MRTTILSLSLLALFAISPTAGAEDWWSFGYRDDHVNVRGGGGDRSDHRNSSSRHTSRGDWERSGWDRNHRDRNHRSRRHRHHHTCRYEMRQVAVQQPGYYTQVWVPAHYETVRANCCWGCNHVRYVYVQGYYKRQYVPGQTAYQWQRVKVCGCR